MSETSQERIKFLSDRLSMLITTLPWYKSTKSYKYKMVVKEIEYLQNELKHNNYLSYNCLL